MRSSIHSDRGVAARWLALVIALTLLGVLIPFFIWHSTWFGTPLSDAQIQQYLTSKDHPQQTQHALSQIADRIIRGDKSVARWYPDVAHLVNSSVPQVRETAAWVMGQDNTSAEFHDALLGMLDDSEPLVRMTAALALVRFRDSSGHAIIVKMLAGEPLLAPTEGKLKRLMNVGQPVATDTVVARILTDKSDVELPAGAPGSLAQWRAADGAAVSAGQPIAVLAPSSQMAWEALRALYLIGTPDDLNVIAPYARGVPAMPAQVAEQARVTMKEIHARSGE
ncbi:MAG: HEAT repeat domain-containing protein [Acidobacteriota bacterium]|nr:HEAT repeat domain-containing protein [Acidobacteriota bacterium]